MLPKPPRNYGLDLLQKISMSLMAVLVLLTFFATNLQAVLWQSSQWLVSTVLPAVVVELTNEERSQNNAQPLHRNATLDAAAKMKAENMAKNEYFAHYAPDGTTPWHWFDEAGYVYAHAGENLAIHFTDSSQVVEAWMDSPTHRKNIVDNRFTEIGVGTAKGKFEGYDTVYVVQLFGTPAVRPVPKEPEPVAPTVLAVAAPQPASTPTSIPVEQAANPDVLAVEDSVVPEVVNSETLNKTEITKTENTESELDSEITETQPVAEPIPSPSEDVVVVEINLIATSSGLAIASVTEVNDNKTGASMAGFATRPHLVLQIVYLLLAVVIATLLVVSVLVEARRLHILQVAYGAGMLIVMVGLLWLHTALISGAVIV